ncbi:MAG: AzlC family ABC transporter permease [Oscillospiraceae bacterium]|nr:AzlC family ABC transporter permease [Oscillospiraceae bacterium]
MSDRASWRNVFKTSLPVMAGYMVLGMGFGILLHSRGYGPLWAAAMSLFIYAGSMQFVGVDLLSTGAGLLTAAVTTLFVNARHLFYGVSMLERYHGAGAKKPYLIFTLTDETYSLVCGEAGEDLTYCIRLSLLDHCYWVTGSVLGSLLTQVLPFDTTGIDFSLTALFVTVFLDQWMKYSDHRPALVGLGVSGISLLLFGPENFLLPAMAGILALLLLPDRKEVKA